MRGKRLVEVFSGDPAQGSANLSNVWEQAGGVVVRCDLLLEATNACAIAYGKECHLDVAYLEERLRALNKGQGM